MSKSIAQKTQPKTSWLNPKICVIGGGYLLDTCYNLLKNHMSFSWRCPYCNHDTTITTSNYLNFEERLSILNSVGDHMVTGQFIVCPNEKCNKYTLDLWLTTSKQIGYTNRYERGEILKHWSLVPSSRAQVFPAYVPAPIIQDYQEACLILEGSPKASATLSRRCIQGIIRDFWKVKRPRLIKEIEAIENKVDPLTWKAIDAVRKIGNIGAHMEADINVIIDVDPKEAEKLIELIELLINDTYINHHEREVKLKEITAIAEEKAQKKSV